MSPLGSRDQSRGSPLVFTRRRLLLGIGAASGFAAFSSLLSACSGTPPQGATSAPPPASGATSQPAGAQAGAATPAAAQQAAPGGFGSGTSIKILMSSHFVPAYDTWFDQWAADWGAKNKVDVQADHILSSDLA